MRARPNRCAPSSCELVTTSPPYVRLRRSSCVFSPSYHGEREAAEQRQVTPPPRPRLSQSKAHADVHDSSSHRTNSTNQPLSCGTLLNRLTPLVDWLPFSAHTAHSQPPSWYSQTTSPCQTAFTRSQCAWAREAVPSAGGGKSDASSQPRIRHASNVACAASRALLSSQQGRILGRRWACHPWEKSG